MARLQPLSAKIGEVKFRQKLVDQHQGKSNSLVGVPDGKEILRILKERVTETRKIFRRLKEQGFILSPFLEIGAEKGQRSMVLINNFQAEGYALDLSLESLASASKFARLLNFKKLPELVCADAYHFPFPDESFPFVFCFETLHHFPDPTPIIEEIHRVLTPGGVFYFNIEPIKQKLNLNLWRRDYHLTQSEKLLKAIGILPFLSKIGKSETEHGILEEEFGLETWKKALDKFPIARLIVRPVFFGSQSKLEKENTNWLGPSLLTRLLIDIQGGGVSGWAIKKGQTDSVKFALPKINYPKQQGVLMALPKSLQKKLYG